MSETSPNALPSPRPVLAHLRAATRWTTGQGRALRRGTFALARWLAPRLRAFGHGLLLGARFSGQGSWALARRIGPTPVLAIALMLVSGFAYRLHAERPVMDVLSPPTEQSILAHLTAAEQSTARALVPRFLLERYQYAWAEMEIYDTPVRLDDALTRMTPAARAETERQMAESGTLAQVRARRLDVRLTLDTTWAITATSDSTWSATVGARAMLRETPTPSASSVRLTEPFVFTVTLARCAVRPESPDGLCITGSAPEPLALAQSAARPVAVVSAEPGQLGAPIDRVPGDSGRGSLE